MAYTYSKLASTTVGAGGTSAITFSNIPQNYTDLVVKISARYSASGPWDMRLTFNGNASAIYSMRALTGTGSTASSASESTQTSTWLGTLQGITANTFNNMELYIPNYTSSNAKSISTDNVNEANQTDARSHMIAQLWNCTAAINSLSITVSSGTFTQYSTATLYGIRVEL